jgi:hypothetical protein
MNDHEHHDAEGIALIEHELSADCWCHPEVVTVDALGPADQRSVDPDPLERD